MRRISTFNAQKTIDGVIDKLFLRFIPDYVKPNYVTVVRFILIPFVYWALVTNKFGLALFIFTIAASTDFIDGAMARTRNQITDIGKVIDPIADKLLILSVLLYVGFDYIIVKIFVVFIVFELFAVLMGYFFTFAVGKPMGSNVFGKIKLILQSFSIGFFMIGIIVSNNFVINVSKYILFIALFFAVIAGFETARQKLVYLKKHNIAFLKTKT